VGFPTAECVAAQPGTPIKITLQKVGSASFASAPATNNHATQPDEIDAVVVGGDADNGSGDDKFGGLNRTLPGTKTGKGKPVQPNASPKSNPQLGLHFQGLNHNNQRFANGGNQFSTEPPDQGLCVGNGFVLETVNDVLRVYHTDGTPATGVVDLNTFYGYPAAVNRSAVPRLFGPSVGDPSCIYDSVIGRFIHIATGQIPRRRPLPEQAMWILRSATPAIPLGRGRSISFPFRTTVRRERPITNAMAPALATTRISASTRTQFF
jgi:hypothetical protein